MAKVDDLLQSGSKQIVLAVVAWLAHGCPPDSESRRRRNHEPPKSGIPKRKKTATYNRLSCKIDYLLGQITAMVQSLPNSSRATALHVVFLTVPSIEWGVVWSFAIERQPARSVYR